MPWSNPNELRFPSTETYLSATTDDITVTATLAPRRWSASLGAQIPHVTATLPSRRWTVTLGSQP